MTRLVAAPLGFVIGSLSAWTTNPATTKPWDDVPRFMCSEVITADGSFTAKTEPMLRWLVGYRDGIAALAVLDKRLSAQNVGGIDSDELATAVLAYCKAKQAQPVGDAATGVFELLINTQPGRRLDLALPKR
jgi:hypothetical protein